MEKIIPYEHDIRTSFEWWILSIKMHLFFPGMVHKSNNNRQANYKRRGGGGPSQFVRSSEENNRIKDLFFTKI